MKAQDLKNSILQLAMKGKLVPQNPDDVPAKELLDQIEKEKEQLIKDKKIKRNNKESVIFRDNCHFYEKVGKKGKPVCIDDEIPFDIPDTWEWVRLGNIIQINPRNKIDDDLNVSFIPMTLIDDGYNNSYSTEVRKWGEVKSGYTHFAENDIGIAKITPCFENRKSVIFDSLKNGFGAGTTELHILRPFSETLERLYLFWFSKTSYFIDNGVKSFTGTAGQQRIGKKYVENCLFPLPPLEEQKRIVKKIEELLPYVKEYGKTEEKLTKLNHEFPEQIRKSVLNEAFKGRIVQQNKNDEDAVVLLEKNKEKKDILISKGKIKKINRLKDINNEFLYELPQSWKWTIANEACLFVTDGTHDTPQYVENGIPLITSKNLKENGLDFSISKNISHEDYEQIKMRSGVEEGDILFAMIGTIGNPVIVPSDDKFSIKNVGLFKKNESVIDSKYLKFWLDSPNLDMLIKKNKFLRGTSQKFIALGNLRSLPVPLAPLNEQKRIVERIELIFEIIDKLRDEISLTEKCNVNQLKFNKHDNISTDSKVKTKFVSKPRTLDSFEGPLKDKTGK